MSAMSYAHGVAWHQRRQVVRWRGWSRREWEQHRLYPGSGLSVWDDCCRRQVIDVTLAPYPETSLVGPYLRYIRSGIEERPRLDHPSMLERRPPQFFDGPVSGDDLVYVDIDRAYLSIYGRATLDVSYDGVRPPRDGVIRFLDLAELAPRKLARNALIGMLRRRRRPCCDHGQWTSELIPSWRRRPDLWGLVMDCLELVGWTARDLGAVYLSTDGAVFTHHDLAEEWIDLLRRRFLLSASVRARGPGALWALGNLHIGDEVSGRECAGNRIDSMIRAPRDLAPVLEAWLHDAGESTRILDCITPTTPERTPA